MYYQFLKEVFLLPEWWKQLPKAALQKQKNNENCHPSKTWYSYFHPEQGSHCHSLQWPHPQIVQEHHYLKERKTKPSYNGIKTNKDTVWKQYALKEQKETKQKLSQWALNLLKQKSKCLPQMTYFRGSTSPGMSQENQTSSTEGRCWFCLHHRWAQDFLKCFLLQNLAPISLGLPNTPENLYYGTHYSLQQILMYLSPW